MQNSSSTGGTAEANPSQAILAAVSQSSLSNYYHSTAGNSQTQSVVSDTIQPDRPIGYGAFGVVW